MNSTGLRPPAEEQREINIRKRQLLVSDNTKLEGFEKKIEDLGWIFGLESVSALIDELDISALNPDRQGRAIPLIHVAGTNGKGSVCMLLKNIFMAAGLKCGLFTSPAVFDPFETITVNDRAIDKENYEKLMELMMEASERVVKRGISHPTAFEVKTALAYYYFYMMGCDIIVFETGLGGELDATNFVNNPLCSVISEIGIDHTDILGASIESIAHAKAGIVKPNSVVFDASTSALANNIIKKKADEVGAKYIALPFTDEDEKKEGFGLKSPAACQKKNAHTAAVVARYALESSELADKVLFDESYIRDGIESCVFPGRFEKICDEPLVYIDGAHNVQAVNELKKNLLALGMRKCVFVMGMLRDKDYKHVLDIMCPLAESVNTITIKNSRTLLAGELSDEVKKRNVSSTAYENIEDALKNACDKAREKSLPVIVFGSFYYLGDVKRIFEKM